MNAQPAAGLPSESPRFPRRQRIIATVVCLALLCSGVTSCTKTQIALSITAIAAVVVGTTVGVTLAIQHSRHTLNGCISSGAGGTELRMSDGKVYTLKGELTDIKVGDKLKIHGSKVKKVKGNTAGQVFVVEKVNKDYGPCPASFGTATATAH